MSALRPRGIIDQDGKFAEFLGSLRSIFCCDLYARGKMICNLQLYFSLSRRSAD
jgi:hypothetical protein